MWKHEIKCNDVIENAVHRHEDKIKVNMTYDY